MGEASCPPNVGHPTRLCNKDLVLTLSQFRIDVPHNTQDLTPLKRACNVLRLELMLELLTSSLKSSGMRYAPPSTLPVHSDSNFP